jgi:2-dehydropantoate 2-reductase
VDYGRLRVIVVGAGPAGGTLAAFLIAGGHDVAIVDNARGLAGRLRETGLRVTGAAELTVPVRCAVASLEELIGWDADLVIVAIKAPVVPVLCPSLAEIAGPRTVFLAYQNGIDTEAPLVESFGARRVARAVVRYGANQVEPGHVRMTFWHRPNFIGGLHPELAPFCECVAASMTASGLPTKASEDIRTRVWEKTIANAMNSLSAVTGLTIGAILDIPVLRQTFVELLKERIAIARASEIAVRDGFLEDLVIFHETAREHMPSTYSDIQQGLPTEVDWMEGKFVEYARRAGLPCPVNHTLLALVKGRTAATEIERAKARAAEPAWKAVARGAISPPIAPTVH